MPIESSPFDPVDERPPTPEERAALEKAISDLGIDQDLDKMAAEQFEQDLEEATVRGENAALSLWTSREQLREKLAAADDPKETDDIRHEIEVLNVAITELEQGDAEAAEQYYDFDNRIADLQRSLEGTRDAAEAGSLQKEIEALRRKKKNLQKFAAIRRSKPTV